MAIFKYTVANQEGKKLSGTVEAPDELTARNELNNLGFSILLLQETSEQPNIDSSLTKFVFESLDKNSKLVTGTIPAKDQDDALKKLQEEYSVNVTAIWPEGATEEEITKARAIGGEKMRNLLTAATSQAPEANENVTVDPLKIQEQEFVKEKIDHILIEVNKLLQKFDQELDPNQKAEINKKINKLLRIKNSTNLEYILATAEELLEFIQKQEQNISSADYAEKRFQLKVETKQLMSELKQQQRGKSLSEDIIDKIQSWQRKNVSQATEASGITGFINRILLRIKTMFDTPAEVLVLKNQISSYNQQIWEFIQLYFKEPTPEYKQKVKQSIKTIWAARKKTKEELKELKKSLKEKNAPTERQNGNFFIEFIEELNSLSGWLLAFYSAYYIVGLYISSKDFGLSVVPKGFSIYDSYLFKYILVILFLLHISTSVKINFFRNSLAANIILPLVFTFSSTLVVLNF